MPALIQPDDTGIANSIPAQIQSEPKRFPAASGTGQKHNRYRRQVRL